MTITIHDNWYNIRSSVNIPDKKLNEINSIIGQIGSAHNGLRWLYVVDSDKDNLGKFDINLNGHVNTRFAENLTLSQVVEHLETIRITLMIFRREYKIDDAYIMQIMSCDKVRQVYSKCNNPDNYTKRIESSIIGTIKGEYQY